MLIELIRRAAVANPERPAIVSSAGTLTYAGLLARSEAVGKGLHNGHVRRFGCAVSEPSDVLVSLAAASLVGSEACVYPRDLAEAGWARFAVRFGHHVVVTDKPATVTGAQAIPLTVLETGEGELPAAADRAPLLILTTGTTGEPKGARYEWARLVRGFRRAEGTQDERWLLVYNPNQFAGLQVILHAMACGVTLVVPSSRQPADVLAAMQDHDVTHASATPTFWRLLIGTLDRATADALDLRQITLGGEAAPEALLRKLSALFPHAGISHVYAGTEFGSVVSVRDGHSGLPLSVLDRTENADVQLRIVDGELQMRSAVGMLGYHDEVSSSAGWRATGDLVEVRGDRIHFVGRTSEIINVGGAKVHPLPIEEIVASLEGVELAAVYGRANPVTGQIVALDVVASTGVDTTELERRIRTACAALPAAGRPRQIRFVSELETRGNKLVRGKASA